MHELQPPETRTEGTPTSILEAMAHALPIIASDVGGISTVVDPMHSGLLVAPCNLRVSLPLPVVLRENPVCVEIIELFGMC